MARSNGFPLEEVQALVDEVDDYRSESDRGHVHDDENTLQVKELFHSNLVRANVVMAVSGIALAASSTIQMTYLADFLGSTDFEA